MKLRHTNVIREVAALVRLLGYCGLFREGSLGQWAPWLWLADGDLGG